jgi:hypothetical protein
MLRRAGRASWKALAGAWLAATAGTAEAQYAPPIYAPAPAPALSGDRLQRMSAAELDQLYRSAGPGAQPRGRVHGVPIVSPGKPMGPSMSKAARVVWQGKVFRDDGTTAVNRFFGVRAIQGNLSYAPSWVDGRPALILDYQGTSLVYGRYRDEIRQVGPNLYLGVMFARTQPAPTIARYFAFETRP